MGALAGGLGGAGGVFESFLVWGVLSQLISPILTPITQAILDETYPRLTSARISPEQCADLVLRHWWDCDSAAAEAAASGISRDRFERMVDDVGEPLALEQLLEAFRRGFIDWDSGDTRTNSVVSGIRQSRVRDQWQDVVQKLVVGVIPVGDAVAAAVKGQVPYVQAEQIAFYNGISSADFRVLYDTAGNPPGPGELIELTRRGIIPEDGTGPSVLSLQQGIYEGMTKDKWWTAYQALMVYLPPPRTITALERSGVLPPAEAQKLYQQSGLSPQLAAIYSANATTTKLAKTKELAEGTVLKLYTSGTIDRAETAALLGDLGYTAQETDWLLSWTDLHRELAALDKAITKVSALYIARKIGVETATAALGAFGLPGTQQQALLADWTLERDASVRTLTPAEIGDAVKYGIITQDQGQTALQALGYQPFDAWVRLSLSQDTPMPNQPPAPADITGASP
jgi:hypothetical protein